MKFEVDGFVKNHKKLIKKLIRSYINLFPEDGTLISFFVSFVGVIRILIHYG